MRRYTCRLIPEAEFDKSKAGSMQKWTIHLLHQCKHYVVVNSMQVRSCTIIQRPHAHSLTRTKALNLPITMYIRVSPFTQFKNENWNSYTHTYTLSALEAKSIAIHSLFKTLAQHYAHMICTLHDFSYIVACQQSSLLVRSAWVPSQVSLPSTVVV
jgi:hypothetical protein